MPHLAGRSSSRPVACTRSWLTCVIVAEAWPAQITICAAKSFTRWLVHVRRALEDRLAHLSQMNVDTAARATWIKDARNGHTRAESERSSFLSYIDDQGR